MSKSIIHHAGKDIKKPRGEGRGRKGRKEKGDEA
jgi:hypothetical protein